MLLFLPVIFMPLLLFVAFMCGVHRRVLYALLVAAAAAVVFREAMVLHQAHPSGPLAHEWAPEQLRGVAVCSIDRRRFPSELSAHDFFNQYVRRGKPVLITNVVQDWPAWWRWTEPLLRRHLGSHKFEAGAAAMLLARPCRAALFEHLTRIERLCRLIQS